MDTRAPDTDEQQRTLASLLGAGPLPLDQALRLLRSLCGAVTELHRLGCALGVLHPRYVLLDGAQGTEQGVSVRVPELSAALETVRDELASYLSPEAAQRQQPVPASDVYCLGIVGYELLTGQPPLVGATPAATIIKHILERPRPPRMLRPELSGDLEAAILRALEKDPASRQQTPSQLLADLIPPTPASSFERVLAAPAPAAMMATGAFRAMPSKSRSGRGIALAIGVLALAAAGLGLGVRLRRGAETAARGVNEEIAERPRPAAPETTAPPVRVASSPPPRIPQPAQQELPVALPAPDEKPAVRRIRPARHTAKKRLGPLDIDGIRPDLDGIGSLESGGASQVEPKKKAPHKGTPHAPGRTQPPAPEPPRRVPVPEPEVRVPPRSVSTAPPQVSPPVLESPPVSQDARNALQGNPLSGGGDEVPPVAAPSMDRWPLLLAAALVALCCAALGVFLLRRRRLRAPALAAPPQGIPEARGEATAPTLPAPSLGDEDRTVADDTLPGTAASTAPGGTAGEMEPFLVGQYRCFARLGEGGMGMVYKARHVHLDRLSAVKVLLPQAALRADSVNLFRREAQLASSITHPNSVFIYDYGEVGTTLFYLAMEYIDGQSLADVLQPDGQDPRPLPLPRVLELTRQICSALGAAHAAGIVHRDLKPQNIMVCQKPRPDLVKVVDFGIARSLVVQSEFKTMTGAVMGTPAYMSPEQANGEPDLDARSDIFSLGLVVYRMLSGTLPFRKEGMTPMQQIIQRALLKDLPPPIRSVCPGLPIPAGVEQAILHALEPDRGRRTPTAAQFIRELEQAA